MRMAVSSDGKTIKNSKIIPTPQNFEQGLQVIKEVSEELKESEEIQKIAGGIAGSLNKEKTMVVGAPHLTDWIRKPLKQELEEIFSCEVFIENDTALNGLGEASKGAGEGAKIIAYLGIGTGVGGAKIENGKIDENSLGFEPGHQIIVADGKSCHCGSLGHLEAYIAGSYMETNYGKTAEDLTDEAAWEKIAKYLAIGLNNVIVHWSPDKIVLGGSITKSISIEKVNMHLKNMLKIFPTTPEIVKAALDSDAGLCGALTLLASS